MAQAVVMPKLGLTMTEGTLRKWYKKEGDAVALGEKIFEVETDKLTNSVESTQEGILRKILVQEGSTVNCLVPVGVLGTADEDISAFTGAASTETPPAPQSAPASAAAAPAPSAPAAGGRIIAAPAAKKLAQEKGIDLALVTGTGPGGRITISDVEKAEKSIASPSTVKASPLAAKMAAEEGVSLADVPSKGRVMSGDVVSFMASRGAEAQSAEALEERVPMSAMRKVIAKRMRESADISPTVTLNIGADMTAMKACKAALASEGLKVSYTDLLVKVVSKVLMEFPLVNCSIDGTDIIFKRYVNMGVAVALEEGLVVPVVRNTHAKSLAQISGEIRDLAGRAKEGKLGPDSMTGGTFTITNLGMFGIESFTPIINQPEVAILGVNAMTDAVVCVDGAPVVRPVMRFSLTTDHRAIDGAVAAQFLSKLKKYIENPALMLLA